jgi:hypothetical protein
MLYSLVERYGVIEAKCKLHDILKHVSCYEGWITVYMLIERDKEYLLNNHVDDGIDYLRDVRVLQNRYFLKERSKHQINGFVVQCTK